MSQVEATCGRESALIINSFNKAVATKLMANSRVRVLTQVTARDGREAELRELLLQVVEQRCQKEGCIRCDLLRHHIHSTDFILVEEWELEARMKSTFSISSLEKLFERGIEFIAERPSIHWYEVVQTQICTN